MKRLIEWLKNIFWFEVREFEEDNRYKRYTTEEDNIIIGLHDKGLSPKEISVKLNEFIGSNRTWASVRNRTIRIKAKRYKECNNGI